MSLLIRTVWLSLAGAVLISPLVPVLQRMAQHGRLREPASPGRAAPLSRAARLFTAFRRWTVPKRRFVDFYATGGACVAAAWRLLEARPAALYVVMGRSNAAVPLDWCCRLTLALVAGHLARRALECSFIVVYADARMHIAAYCLGVGHYVLLAISLLLDGASAHAGRALSPWRALVGCALFAAASAVQHSAARTLARIRRGGEATAKYGVPQGGSFALLTSPHLSAEVGIYAALVVVAGPRLPSLRYIAAWVTCNQAVSARAARKWYLRTFPAEFPSERWVLLPFVW